MEKNRGKPKNSSGDNDLTEQKPSSSDTDDDNRAGTSTKTLNRSKNFKKRSCRQKELGTQLKSSGTVHKMRKQLKRHNSGTSAGKESSTLSANEDESNNDAGNDNSDEWTPREEETNVVPQVLRKIKPKPQLSIISEVMQRQIGRRAHFESKFYGSLHMVERLKYLHSLDEHQGCVNTVEFNAKGDLLVSGSDDLAIVMWNWAIKKKCNSYESGHRNNIFQASWLPHDDLSLMVTCASDGEIRLLDLVNGATRRLASHHGACNKFTIHPEFPYVAISVGDDGKVLSIDVRDGETSTLMTMTERAFAVELYTIHSNPRNSNEFCVGGHSESVRIYDRRKPSAEVYKLCPRNLANNERVHVTAVTYNHNGTEILASYNDDDIYLFDTLILHPDGDYAHKYEGHRNSKAIKGVNYFGPKSEFIVSGSDCGNIYFWEKNTEAIVQCIPADAQGVVNCVKPHPYIPVLASSGLDNDVKIWVPSASEAPTMTHLNDCVTTNLSGRMNGRTQCRDPDDVNLFCIILEHLCHNRDLFGTLNRTVCQLYAFFLRMDVIIEYYRM